MSSVRQANELPVRYDMTVYRGDPYTRMFNIVYLDETGTAQTLDTTGWTGLMVVRKDRLSKTGTLFSGSTSNGRLTTGVQTDGVYTWCLMVSMTETDTALETLPAGFVGVYDIELRDTSSRKVTVYTGTFCVEGDVS